MLKGGGEGAGCSGSDVFYMCAAIRRETVEPKATGRAKERQEARF